MAPDVLQEGTAFILKGLERMNAIHSIKMMGTMHPMTQCPIPQEKDPQFTHSLKCSLLLLTIDANKYRKQIKSISQ
jgi:hypothetical protein